MAATEYDFNLTRTEIIDRAFRIVGAIGAGQSANGNQHEQGRIALNSMVARWQSDHIFLWKQDVIEVALVDNTKTYTLSNDPQVLSVDDAFLRFNGSDTDIEVVAWDDYNSIDTKDSKGDPVYVAPEYSTTGITLYTYPVIETAGGKKLFLLVTTKLKDFDTSNANPEIRSAWIDALSYGLADAMSDEYSLPISERQHIQQKASLFYSGVKKTDKKRPDFLVCRGAYE